jgi:hypothetical protein
MLRSPPIAEAWIENFDRSIPRRRTLTLIVFTYTRSTRAYLMTGLFVLARTI